LDGQAAHPVAERWRDIHRDNSLAGVGVMTLRYSWSDITSQRCLVAAEIAAVLNQRGWPGQLRRCGAHCTAPFHDRGRFVRAADTNCPRS
jgi:hypothetical protein